MGRDGKAKGENPRTRGSKERPMTTERQTPPAPAPQQGTRTPAAPQRQQGDNESPRQQGGETGAPRIGDWASI